MRAPLAAVALLALGACALPQGSGPRVFQPYAPLRAHITAPSTPGGPLFHVNRPAYVAMFYIVPGSGVSMLYPGFGSGSLDGRVFAGSHFARSRLTRGEMYQYQFAGRGMLAASPRFYFLIASDRPLNVGQFGSLGTELMSRLGTAWGSFSAYSTMERLARVTLPSLANDGSWTTDMYVEWPNVIESEPGRDRVLMQCGGYTMYVPMEYVPAVQALVCDAQEQAAEEAEEEGREPIAKPKPRAPIPADAQAGTTEEIRVMDPKALVERISSSTQLREPVTRNVVREGRDELGRAMRSRPGSSEGSGRASGPVGAPASRPSSGSSGVTSGGGSSSSGPVSAPASRPSSDGGSSSGGGGGGGGSGPVTAPTSRGGG